MSISSVMRQSACRSAEATRNFFVVRFHADHLIAVTPGKAVISPPPSAVREGGNCKIKWSDGKLYDATVLAITADKNTAVLREKALLQQEQHTPGEELLQQEQTPEKDLLALEEQMSEEEPLQQMPEEELLEEEEQMFSTPNTKKPVKKTAPRCVFKKRKENQFVLANQTTCTNVPLGGEQRVNRGMKRKLSVDRNIRAKKKPQREDKFIIEIGSPPPIEPEPVQVTAPKALLDSDTESMLSLSTTSIHESLDTNSCKEEMTQSHITFSVDEHEHKCCCRCGPAILEKIGQLSTSLLILTAKVDDMQSRQKNFEDKLSSHATQLHSTPKHCQPKTFLPELCDTDSSDSTADDMPCFSKPLPPSPVAEAPKKVAKKGLPPDGSAQLVNNRDIPTDVCATIRRHSCSRKNFGVQLCRAVFSAQERATCNVSGSQSKGQLDKYKMDAIKRTVFALWSLEPGEKEEKEWRQVVIAIDEANRRLNRATCKSTGE